jgi:hypothetical protein
MLKQYRLRVFENRVLNRISGHRQEAVTEDWRKLHNEELHACYSTNIIRVIKEILRERDHLEDLGIHGRIVG